MALYKNTNKSSPIASVELMPAADGNFTFIRGRKDADVEQLKELLGSAAIGQEIISQTNVDGVPLLVTSGAKSRDELMAAITDSGNTLKLDMPKKAFNPWMWRGASSIVGQSFQLLSGFKSFKNGTSPSAKNSADNWAIIGFASTNLVANGVNMAFGAQKIDDPHQLLILKERFNEKYKKYLGDGQAVIDPHDNRAELVAEPEQKTLAGKSHDLAKRYSVSGGEVGLRVLGTVSLAYPATKWGDTLKQLGSGSSLSKLNATARNPDPYTYKVGLYTLLGKAIAFASKAPDPYNPAPHGIIDKIRENVTFKLSSVVEGAAAAAMMYDRYKNKSVMLRGKTHRDWFGTIGNAVFIGGYIVRLFAPFGSREVDMPELKAHITGMMARMPEDKLPEVLAETAADLTHHFKGKYKYSELYTELASDLYKYHGIAVSKGVSALPSTEAAMETDANAKSFAKAHPQKSLDPDFLKRSASYREKVRAANQVNAIVSP